VSQQKAQTEIVDPLYGSIKIDPVISEALFTPEVQRLREVRLANSSLLQLPGGSNVSRYEHSIGVAYLAQLSSQKLVLDSEVRQAFLIAALTHDVVTAAFGHTVEKILNKCGFEHADIRKAILEDAYSGVPNEYLYMGFQPSLRKHFSNTVLSLANEFIQGRHSLGRLIAGDIDLDNIDNVFRLSYHVGIPYEQGTAEILAQSLSTRNGMLLISENYLPQLHCWMDTRKTLYEQLIYRTSNIAAEAMLSRAVEFAIDCEILKANSWRMVDFELIVELMNIVDVKPMLQRLMTGDLFTVFGVIETSQLECYSYLRFSEQRKELENILEELGVDGALFPILDKRQSERKIEVIISETGKLYSLGKDANRLLVALLRQTKDWSKKTKDLFKEHTTYCDYHDIGFWVVTKIIERLNQKLGCTFIPRDEYEYFSIESSNSFDNEQIQLPLPFEVL